MDLSMGLIKADILMAEQAIHTFKTKNIKEIKNHAAYHLQQAAEKLIKIQIYQSGVPYDNRALYTQYIWFDCICGKFEFWSGSSRVYSR